MNGPALAAVAPPANDADLRRRDGSIARQCPSGGQTHLLVQGTADVARLGDDFLLVMRAADGTESRVG
jgi:hypothetical protein